MAAIMPMMIGIYFVLTYVVDYRLFKLPVGILLYLLCGYVVYEGNLFYKIRKTLLCYIMLVGTDILCVYILLTWMPIENREMMIALGTLIGKNIYNYIYFCILIMMEFMNRRKDGIYLKMIAFVALCFAVCQIAVMYVIVQINLTDAKNNVVLFSVLCSGIVILGYSITMEIFYQIIHQQKKQNELEEKLLERQYQYEYYLLAYEQGEKIRDFRHDMRNQLQTIHYLMNPERWEEKNSAEEMLNQLREKIKTFNIG